MGSLEAPVVRGGTSCGQNDARNAAARQSSVRNVWVRFVAPPGHHLHCTFSEGASCSLLGGLNRVAMPHPICSANRFCLWARLTVILHCTCSLMGSTGGPLQRTLCRHCHALPRALLSTRAHRCRHPRRQPPLPLPMRPAAPGRCRSGGCSHAPIAGGLPRPGGRALIVVLARSRPSPCLTAVWALSFSTAACGASLPSMHHLPFPSTAVRRLCRSLSRGWRCYRSCRGAAPVYGRPACPALAALPRASHGAVRG